MQAYKVISRDGQEDFLTADSLEMATAMGIVTYGPGVAVRAAYYGEWDCGVRCGYDVTGRHYYVAPDGSHDYGPKSK